ncbi:MAG: 5-formyltetrahydrofolate cyclo-ligase [Clostridia bacterium]
MDKAAMRACITARMNALMQEEKESSDCKILEDVLKLEEYKAAKTIFTYLSVGCEVDTRRLIEQALQDGKRVAIPRVISRGEMEAVLITGKDELVAGQYDIPTARDGAQVIPPSEIELAVVPAVAFDVRGNRLGHGGGYYDRYLSNTRAFMLGLARDCQIVEEIPAQMHDVPVDSVVSDGKIDVKRNDS